VVYSNVFFRNTGKCTLSEGWLLYFEEPTAEEDIQMEYSSD
jgi:hypothetical protein